MILSLEVLNQFVCEMLKALSLFVCGHHCIIFRDVLCPLIAIARVSRKHAVNDHISGTQQAGFLRRQRQTVSSIYSGMRTSDCGNLECQIDVQHQALMMKGL